MSSPAAPPSSSSSAADKGGISWINDVLKPPKHPKTFHAYKTFNHSQPGDDLGEVMSDEITYDKQIGAGSFGAVWKGHCRGHEVAIKQCKVGDHKDAEMLVKEIRYLQRLRHERLVAFLGCCNSPPHVILLMEFCRGGSLHNLLFSRKKNPPMEIKLRMAFQVAEGLAYLHGLSIVHRDLKTMNIVMDDRANCKICDFGLTITLEKTHMTIKSLQGSPRYMAPEQFESSAKITEKVDIWQMGCIMLELFCLTVPFSSCQNIQQIATELLMKKKPPPIPDSADPRARAFIHACFRIHPKQRPDAEALKEALEGAYEAAEAKAAALAP